MCVGINTKQSVSEVNTELHLHRMCERHVYFYSLHFTVNVSVYVWVNIFASTNQAEMTVIN